jgi:hypothetical protein
VGYQNFSTKKDVSNIKYTTKYKTEYKLSLIQKEALIGIILGDGFPVPFFFTFFHPYFFPLFSP